MLFRSGKWLLLDEVNLAAAETLERVAGVLESGGSVALTEKGEAEPVPRHPSFRVFAAMNPPTDFGKKELPASIRSRMTELYVPSLSDPADLQLVVLQALRPVMPHPPVQPIVTFYQAALAAAESALLDGAGQRPQFSLRTLCRALGYTARMLSTYGLERSLYDAFHMNFVTQLQQQHQPAAEALILRHLLPKKQKGGAHGVVRPPPAAPNRKSGQEVPPQKIKSGSRSPPVIIGLLSTRAASAAASCLAATSLRFLSCERLSRKNSSRSSSSSSLLMYSTVLPMRGMTKIGRASCRERV